MSSIPLPRSSGEGVDEPERGRGRAPPCLAPAPIPQSLLWILLGTATNITRIRNPFMRVAIIGRRARGGA